MACDAATATLLKRQKPIGTGALGVVARGAKAAEREVGLAGQQPLGRPHGAPRGVERRLAMSAPLATVSWSIIPPPSPVKRLDRVDVRGGVDALQRLAIGRRCLDALEAEPVALGQGCLDRDEPPGVLGVRAGVVEVRGGVGDVEGHSRVP